MSASRNWALLAWLAAISAAVVVAGASVAGQRLGNPPEDYSWVLSWLGFPLVGGVVASRRPRHPVGWILIGIGACVGLGVGGSLYAEYAIIDRPGALPGARYVLLLIQPVLIVGFGLLPFFVLFFPTGVATPRWKRMALGGAIVFGALTVAYMFRGVLQLEGGKQVSNPLRIRPVEGFLQIAIVPLTLAAFAFAAAVCVHLVWRYRRSAGIERSQLKWFTFAVAITAGLWSLGVLSSFLATSLGGPLVVGASLLGLNGIAVAVGVAILRHRLYDIDKIISRTLGYAIVSAFLGGMFVLVVLVPTALIGSGTRTPDWLIAVGTLAVAAFFRPVRRRVQEAVDHRFNRARYDAVQTIEAFTMHLRDEVDLAALQTELVNVVHRTMQPERVSLWIAQPGPNP